MRNKKGNLWYPFYVDKWLFGSTRLEFEPAERSVWIDLLTLSQKDEGYIRANMGCPYQLPQLAGMFCVSVQLLESTIKKAIQNEKLKQLDDGTLYVCSYETYRLSDRQLRRYDEEKFIPKYKRFVPCPPKFLSMATKKGLVRKSRLLVAIAINRPLKKGEEVHHIDNNENNDEIDNLSLFRTHKEHLRYQAGYEVKPIWFGKEIDSAAKKDIMAEFAAYIPYHTIPKQSIIEQKHFTEKQVKDECFKQGLPENEASKIYADYAKRDWKDGAGQAVTDLTACVMNWRLRMPEYSKDDKRRLPIIPGKTCSKDGCKMPAVYKDSSGSYDFYYCEIHLPQKVKEKYG